MMNTEKPENKASIWLNNTGSRKDGIKHLYDLFNLFQLFNLVNGKACSFCNLLNRQTYLFQIQSWLNGLFVLDDNH